jgi:poly(A) polymerase
MTRSVSPQKTVLDALPAGEAAVVARLGRTFTEAKQELVLVGGIVRDALMGHELPNDLDFATNATPERTQEIGEAAGASSVYLVGAKFGTVGLVFADETGAPITAEVTTYRSEHYPHETRHPEVAFGDRLEDDLSRRDFTVNAIAADAVTGALIDPFDGQADLARGIIRAVGDPDTRFREDPLRLLRAARFVAQLGFFVEPETAAAMARQAPSLARISKERIYGELTRLLTGAWASHGLETLHETGLVAVAMPELAPLAAETESRGGRGMPHREKDLWEHTKKVVDRAPTRPIVRWAALLHDAAKPQTRSVDATGEVHFFGHEREGAALAKRLLGRLKADRSTQVAVARLVELHLRPAAYEADWTDSAVRRLMLEADGVLDDLLDLVAADVTSAREQKQRAAARRIELLRAHIRRLEKERALAEFKSPLDGDDLMRLFARPPGRWIAIIKDHLRELVIDGELAPDDRATAEEIARGMIERGKM